MLFPKFLLNFMMRFEQVEGLHTMSAREREQLLNPYALAQIDTRAGVMPSGSSGNISHSVNVDLNAHIRCDRWEC